MADRRGAVGAASGGGARIVGEVLVAIDVGTSGARAAVFEPILRIASAGGPMNTTPASAHPAAPFLASLYARQAKQQAKPLPIPPDIFDVPTCRSLKVIGTSRIRAPAREARYVISTWNP